MLHGARMAIDEANARGGYGGKPFRLLVHNDGALWGASSNEVVKMVYDEKVWAMLGSVSGDSTHIALRVSLRSELPIVNSAATDPTIPETIIPWYFTTHAGRSSAVLHAGAPHLHRSGTEAHGHPARQRPVWPFRSGEVQGRLAAAGPSGGDRAEVYAGRYRLPAAAPGDQRFARRTACWYGRTRRDRRRS